MKKLHEPLENGLIPLVEIAKMLYGDDNNRDPNYVDNPEFHDNKLFVYFCGDRNGCGITEYLHFEDNQFKLTNYDNYWTSDSHRVYTELVEYDPIPLYKKLIELGVMTKEELGF